MLVLSELWVMPLAAWLSTFGPEGDAASLADSWDSCIELETARGKELVTKYHDQAARPRTSAPTEEAVVEHEPVGPSHPRKRGAAYKRVRSAAGAQEEWDITGRYWPGPGPRRDYTCPYPNCVLKSGPTVSRRYLCGGLSAHVRLVHRWRDPMCMLADGVKVCPNCGETKSSLDVLRHHFQNGSRHRGISSHPVASALEAHRRHASSSGAPQPKAAVKEIVGTKDLVWTLCPSFLLTWVKVASGRPTPKCSRPRPAKHVGCERHARGED